MESRLNDLPIPPLSHTENQHSRRFSPSTAHASCVHRKNGFHAGSVHSGSLPTDLSSMLCTNCETLSFQPVGQWIQANLPPHWHSSFWENSMSDAQFSCVRDFKIFYKGHTWTHSLCTDTLVISWSDASWFPQTAKFLPSSHISPLPWHLTIPIF